MADPLLDILLTPAAKTTPTPSLTKYLHRLLSLRPSDLDTTEPQSLSQAAHSNTLSLQALSSRSHRSTTSSSDQLAALGEELPSLSRTAGELRAIVPRLDETVGEFTASYSRARTNVGTGGGDERPNSTLSRRKDVMLFARQAERLQDMLELPGLLATAIASAGATGSANYSQALDLYAHIKRLGVLYPESRLVRDVQDRANEAMKGMTVNLLGSLRGQNIRLAAAIRTIGWLRRVVPELGSTSVVCPSPTTSGAGGYIGAPSAYAHVQDDRQAEGSFGALFLAARLSTFLAMTEDALAPLRDLADQESEKRMQSLSEGERVAAQDIQHGRGRGSVHGSAHAVQGQQTERYLKRYIEMFREQSFATIQMYRNIFPQSATSTATDVSEEEHEQLRLPTALASFPLHLVSLLMETLQTYLPNVTDSAARESLLIQVLYAANSLGRLGADFSMMISLLDLPSAGGVGRGGHVDGDGSGEGRRSGDAEQEEPEWYRVIKKHKVQAARLDALASGQDSAARTASQDVPVR